MGEFCFFMKRYSVLKGCADCVRDVGTYLFFIELLIKSGVIAKNRFPSSSEAIPL